MSALRRWRSANTSSPAGADIGPRRGKFGRMSVELEQGEPTGWKGRHSVARKHNRPYGTGCVYREGRGWAIRWREAVQDENGTVRFIRRYERVEGTKTEAEGILRQRMLQVSASPTSISSTAATPTGAVTFKEHADKWTEHVLPKYKLSTETVH